MIQSWHFGGILYLSRNNTYPEMLDPNTFTDCFSNIPDAETAMEQLANLPQQPGVYLFFGSNDNLLYVGKSIDLRARVRSHYYARHSHHKEQLLIKQTRSIRYQVTDGELSALLLENQLIKQAFPLLNRHLRRTRKLMQIELKPTPDTYYQAHIGDLSQSDDTLGFGAYRSAHKARQHLTQIATKHQLCQRVLGLEKGEGRCFAHQLKRCKGACVGTQTPSEFNRTLLTALAGEDIQTWPYDGIAWIGEKAQGNVHAWHGVNQWHYLGKAIDEESANSVRRTQDGQFDLDTYRILVNQLQYNASLVVSENLLPPFIHSPNTQTRES